MKIRSAASILLLTLGITSSAHGAIGPDKFPLKVQYIYTANASWIYIRFSDGAMPGCYEDNSGMLYPGNANFDQLYAQILTMSTTGGFTGKVVYTIVDPTAVGWDDCTIDGMALSPGG